MVTNFFALYANNLAWNATKKKISALDLEFSNENILNDAISQKNGVLLFVQTYTVFRAVHEIIKFEI